LYGGLAVSVFSGTAQAQTETIIVTAQKTEQEIIDVPLTLTAYSGDALERIGVSEFDELALYVPGLQIQEQSVNNPGFVIRGITSDDGSAQIAPRVSVYQDGVDISRSRGSVIELYDLDRVEVLKGPQATLFGSAASIGAIHVISAAPENEFGGKVMVGYGNYDEMRTDGHITGPIVEDRLLARIAWSYKKRDGYVENIDGAPFSQNPQAEQAPALNGTDTFAGRVFLRFLPSDALKADLIFNYQKDTPTGSSFKSGTLPPTGGSTDPFSYAELGPFGSTSSDFLGGDLGIDREVWSLTLDVDYDFNDAWSVNWTSNYRTFDSLEVFDADGSPAYWLELAEDADGEQWSTEFRVNYDDGGPFRAFVGASYFWERGTQRVPFETDEATFGACLAGFCVAPNGAYLALDLNPFSPTFQFPVPRDLAPDVIHREEYANRGRNRTFSVYADGSYDITDWLELTVGVRYLHENRLSGFMSDWMPAVLTGASLLPIGYTGGEFLYAEPESFDAVLPRFNLKARLSETANAYVSIGKGRRSPVVNVQGNPTVPNAIVTDVLPAEIIWNYEGGVKGVTASGRLQYDAAFFYQDYRNFQTTVFQNGVLVPLNAGTATAWGWEASAVGKPADYIDVFFNIAFIDARFDSTDADGNPQLYAGNRFRLQPKWSASAGFSAHRPVGNLGEAFFTATWTFRSKVFFENENAPKAGLDISEDAVSLLNLSAGLRAFDAGWEIEAYVKNVFNKRYLIDAGNTGGNALFNTPTFIAGPPRFYGVALTGRF
jgi:outer membrane receptor protein involved in Fe transport